MVPLQDNNLTKISPYVLSPKRQFVIRSGVMALRSPPSEAPKQVKNVKECSPIEIFLGGLQSVGSWRGFLGYAAMAGFVV